MFPDRVPACRLVVSGLVLLGITSFPGGAADVAVVPPASERAEAALPGGDEAIARFPEVWRPGEAGVFVDGPWLYVAIEDAGTPERGRALSRFNELLLDYAETRFPEQRRWKTSAWLADFPEIARRLAAVAPAVARPSLRLDALATRIFPHVRAADGVAFRIWLLPRAAVEQAIAQSPGPSATEMATALRQLWPDGDAPEEGLIGALSLGVERVALGRDSVPPVFVLTALPEEPVDDPWASAELWRQTDAEVRNQAGDQAMESLGRRLQGLPPGPGVMTWLARRAESYAREEEAAWLHLAAGRYGAEDGDWALSWREAARLVGEWGAAGREMADRLASPPPRAGDVPWPSRVEMVRRTWGMMEFPERVSSERPTELDEAARLFNEGRDLARIIQLSAAGAQAAPRRAEVWRLLGHALLVDNRPGEALPFLHRAVLLAPGEASARGTLALAYDTLQAPVLARGMAAATLACPRPDPWATDKAWQILAREGK